MTFDDTLEHRVTVTVSSDRRLGDGTGVSVPKGWVLSGQMPVKVVRPGESADRVGIKLSCGSSPERTTVKNNTDRTIRIKSVGSTSRPYDFEPVKVSKRLGPGRSVTFQSGPKARKNVLSRRDLFSGRDGVRVRTSAGTFRKRC